MLNDADVIARLESALQPAELSAAIQRLRRVPEAWRALRDADFLGYTLEHPEEIGWTPAAIADCALLYQPSEAPLSPGVDRTTLETHPNAVAKLAAIGRDAHALAKRLDAEPDSAIETIQANPLSWSATLSCAWPHITQSAALLEKMLNVQDREMMRLLTTTLLANFTPTEAVEFLQPHIDKLAPFLMQLSRMGERQLAQSLAEAATDLSLHDATGPVVSEKISMAYVQALSGQYDRAHTLLTTAWDDAMETTARVADSLADTAHDEGNLTIELEARRQSVEKSGTPTRRAALARSLVESNKAYEASLLVAQPERIEERIAYGMAALQQGHTSEALSALSQAKNEALQLELKDASWMAWMAEGLSACGAITETIEAKTYLANLVPHQSSFELELAELWERAGDPSKSIIHARIALGITPDSITARKQLAHSLHIHGEAEKALPYFERVVLEDESVLGEYCECALAAHQAQLGLEVATSLVERQPDSAHAQTLLAKAHQLQGETNLARSAISKAIELGSEEAEPLLMLAEIQVGAGEIDAAGETLALALQIAPDDGRAHYARAQWLARQERVHEACEHSAQAIKLEPHATNWIVDHAELLSKKGDDQEARVFLEEALSQQPKNWRVRENLARSLENTNEIARAIQLVEDPPSDISDQSRFHVGRILIKHGVDAEPAYTHKGMNLIKAAQPASDFKSERIFWLGRSNEALGQYPEALEYYETYLAETETDLEPQALEGMLGYSRVALALEKPEQAIARLQANREKYPTSLALLKLLAEAHLGNGDAKQAFGIAQEALETNPDSIEARKLLGQTAEAVGDIRTAIDAEQDVLAHQPESSDGWSRLAQLYAVIKDVDAARTHLAKAIQIDRRDPDKLQSFAALSGELGWPETQLRLLKHAANQVPEQGALQRSLAELAETAGEYKTAHAAWMRCAEQDPENPDLIKRAATALSKSGQTQSAIALWERALEQDPGDMQVLQNLGQAYIAQGEPQSSLDFYRQLLNLGESDPDVLVVIARAFMQYAAPDESLRIIERALQQAPQHPGLHFARVEALLQSGEGESALAAVESAIKLRPPDAYALGLAALCAVMTDDIERARAGLEEALHETHLSAPAIRVLMLVSAAIGDWRVYVTLLNGLTDAQTTTAIAQRQSLRALLRARDLGWLHSQALNVLNNSPDQAVIEARLQARLDALAEAAINAGSHKSVDVLLRWNQLIESPTTSVESEFEFLSMDERQEYVQAASMSLLHANRPAKALSLLEQYPPTGLYRGYHTLLTGLAALKLEQFPRAKDASRLATRFVETRAGGYYLQAKISLEESELEAAISALNAALSIWPDESKWHTELAQIYTRSERKEAALPHLQQAVELDPHNSENLISLARAYHVAGECSQAEAIYARCLQDAPGSAQIWKEAGEVALIMGHATQAESWFERACSLAPSDAVCLMGSARAAMLMGDTKLAAQRAQSAYKLAPNEPQVLSGFAEILAQQGKTEKAIQAYDRAIKISAGDPNVQLARSRLLMKTNQFADAISDIKAVLDLDSEDPVAWALLAEAHEQSDHLEQALTAINHALEFSPRAGAYRLTQGRIYRKSGQLDQALKVLRDLEISEPENPELPGELGNVYEARRETDAALEAYLRAVALNKKDVGSSMRAGLILKGLKSYQQAAEMFEHVVIARPNDAVALHQLAAVRALQLVHGGSEHQVVAS